MTEHSQGPWRVAGDRPEGVIILSADDRVVAVAVPPYRGKIDAGTRADAARIVGAVNACRGLDASELEGSDLGARLYDLGRSMARDAAALGLIRRLVEKGYGVRYMDHRCNYCGFEMPGRYAEDGTYYEAHEPDCPYAAARAFLGGREGDHGDG